MKVTARKRKSRLQASPERLPERSQRFCPADEEVRTHRQIETPGWEPESRCQSAAARRGRNAEPELQAVRLVSIISAHTETQTERNKSTRSPPCAAGRKTRLREGRPS